MITKKPFYTIQIIIYTKDLKIQRISKVSTFAYKRIRFRITNHLNPLIFVSFDTENIADNHPRRPNITRAMYRDFLNNNIN